MVVAVITVLVVQTAVDDVVNVIAVRYGFVAATFAVNVAVAGVNRVAAVRVGFIDAQGMLVVVAVVLMEPYRTAITSTTSSTAACITNTETTATTTVRLKSLNKTVFQTAFNMGLL